MATRFSLQMTPDPQIETDIEQLIAARSKVKTGDMLYCVGRRPDNGYDCPHCGHWMMKYHPWEIVPMHVSHSIFISQPCNGIQHVLRNGPQGPCMFAHTILNREIDIPGGDAFTTQEAAAAERDKRNGGSMPLFDEDDRR